MMRVRLLLLAASAGLILSGCASTSGGDAELPAYVVMGPDGGAVVRVLSGAAACPDLTVDGKSVAMTLRAPAEIEPLRPTRSSPALSKPSNFPSRVCEFNVPHSAHRIALGGRDLPLPPARVDRIVVIGDTGCRLKQSDNAYQGCNLPDQYPFAQVAGHAAEFHPDLVVHVGDYLYRENPCVQGDTDCAGSPWGYGEDAWRADFFTPARALLAVAPWVLVRGNHESCNRAGQGWWRFLDARALQPGRDCVRAEDDDSGDYTPAFAVPIGSQEQIIVMDTSNVPAKPLAHDDPRAAHYRQLYQEIDALARRVPHSIGVDHHPILAFFAATAPSGQTELLPGNLALQSVFHELNPHILPAGIDVMLSGHIHLWEQISFVDTYPSQFVTGFSGTQEDIVPLPAVAPAGATPVVGGQVAHMSSWVDGFGYMTMQRQGVARWDIVVWDRQGQAVNHCHLDGRTSICDLAQVGVH